MFRAATYAMRLIFLLFFIDITNASINWGFEKFLKDRYGNNVAELIKRSDMGGGGSFGGGQNGKVR